MGRRSTKKSKQKNKSGKKPSRGESSRQNVSRHNNDSSEEENENESVTEEPCGESSGQNNAQNNDVSEIQIAPDAEPGISLDEVERTLSLMNELENEFVSAINASASRHRELKAQASAATKATSREQILAHAKKLFEIAKMLREIQLMEDAFIESTKSVLKSIAELKSRMRDRSKLDEDSSKALIALGQQIKKVLNRAKEMGKRGKHSRDKIEFYDLPPVPPIPFIPVFTDIKDFQERDEIPIFKGYQSFCVTEFTRPKDGFVELSPGIFTLSLGISYKDDFKIIITIYPNIQFNDELRKVEENLYLLEERVLQYLDNFSTELLCKIFESILKEKDEDDEDITEYEYLEQMQRMFGYTVSTSMDEIKNYSANELKSKYVPGRSSDIDNLFEKYNFK